MLNRIYNENCLTTLGCISDKVFDMVITSPPYDSLREYNGYKFEFEKIAKELTRCLKPGGVIVWIVGDETKKGSESLSSFKQAIYFTDYCGLNLHDTMIYEKGAIPYPSSNRYNQIFEYMFIFSKGKPKTFNPIKDRKNLWAGHKAHWGKPMWRQKDGTMKEVEDNHIIPEYSMRTNIWRYAIGKGNSTKDEIAYKHPAIFPEQLVEDVMISWSKKGEIIYDPFMGSGTVGKIALKNERFYVGSEISEEYCKIAETRIKDFSKKLKENKSEEFPVVKVSFKKVDGILRQVVNYSKFD